MKKPYLALIFMVFVCSCSQEEVIKEQTTTIKFTSACIDVKPTTKVTTYPLPNGSKVGVSSYLITSGIEATDYNQTKKYTISDDAGTLTPDNGSAMKIESWDNTDYMFYAYSPAKDFNSGSKKTISVANGDDFMLSYLQQTLVPGMSQTIALPAMTRKCSQVEFLIQCVSGTFIKSLTIAPNGLTLNDMTHSPIDYTLGSGDINITSAATDATCSVPQTSFYTHTAGVEYLADATVLPKVDAAFSFSLDINLTASAQGDGVTTTTLQTMKATLPHLPFAPGYKYRYILTFCDAGAILRLQVLPWNTINTTNNFGQGGQLTEADWNAIANSLNQGLGGNTLNAGIWNTGVIWNTGTAVGTVDGTVTVGIWNTGVTWNTGTAVGTPQAFLSIGSWVVNPNWTAIMGNVMNSLNIVGWNTNSGSPSMGQ